MAPSTSTTLPTPVPASQKTDLVTDILGIQVDARASTVQWSSGQRTVLPFLPKRARNRRLINVLAKDARYVRDLATLPEADLSSTLVTYLDKNVSKQELFKAACEALSRNKTVVAKGYVDTHSFDFNLIDLEEHLRISPHRPVEAHGLSLCSSSSLL